MYIHKKFLIIICFLILSRTIPSQTSFLKKYTEKINFEANKKAIVICAIPASIITLIIATIALQTKKLNPHFTEFFKNHNNNWYFYRQSKNNPKEDPLLIYLHGFGENGNDANYYFDKFKQINILAPCLEFTNKTKKQKTTRLFNTSFGQTNEIIQVLYGLKKYYINQEKTGNIILVGRSRGGALLANVLGVLSDKNNTLLQKSKISEADLENIIEKLKL